MYWCRELTVKDPKSELGYTLTLLVDCSRVDRPLNIVHIPSLGCMVSTCNVILLIFSFLLVSLYGISVGLIRNILKIIFQINKDLKFSTII